MVKASVSANQRIANFFFIRFALKDINAVAKVQNIS
jgi:hypothetical protein